MSVDNLVQRVEEVLSQTSIPRSGGDREAGYIVERWGRSVSVRWQRAGAGTHVSVRRPRELLECQEALLSAGLGAHHSDRDDVSRVIVLNGTPVTMRAEGGES